MKRNHDGLCLGWLAPSLVLCSVITVGCRAQEIELATPALPQIPTHRAVPQPPSVSADQLWVALEDHLGRGTSRERPASALLLRSAGVAPLTLRPLDPDVDAPLLAEAGTISISWQLVPLEQPVKVSRQVVGPYASFESADQVAQRWRRQGVKALVAHPGEWEVWAPETAMPPKGVSSRPWRQTVTSAVRPVVVISGKEHVLRGPLQLEAPDGLRWNGGVMQGPFRLQPDAYGSWTLLEQVPLERYLEGVVPHEIGAGSPAAALQAQAILARTWALANSHRFDIDGYHLCSDTQCQVYSDPRQAGSAVRQAITATQGRLLSWQDKPISAVYHASNGGVMAAGPEAWAMDAQPYLRAEADGDAGWRQRHGLPLQQRSAVASLLAQREGAYGSAHPRFRWTRTLTASGIRQALGPSAEGLRGPLQLDVLERGRSGRVLALQVSGTEGGAPVVLKLDRIRRTIRRLPSTLFVIEPQGDQRWLVRGGGFGHGAGLSQAGAIDLAWRGWSTERILAHYYPGTVYGPLLPPLQSP